MTANGLRDRAILSVRPQVGLRRAEIAGLKVGDPHRKLRFNSRGGCSHRAAIDDKPMLRHQANANFGEVEIGPLGIASLRSQ